MLQIRCVCFWSLSRTSSSPKSDTPCLHDSRLLSHSFSARSMRPSSRITFKSRLIDYPAVQLIQSSFSCTASGTERTTPASNSPARITRRAHQTTFSPPKAKVSRPFHFHNSNSTVQVPFGSQRYSNQSPLYSKHLRLPHSF